MLLGSDTAARKKVISHKSPLKAGREGSVQKFAVTKPSATADAPEVYPEGNSRRRIKRILAPDS